MERVIPRLVKRLLVPQGLDPWTVEAGDFAVVPRPAVEGSEYRYALRVESDGDQKVTVPGPFDPRSFTRVGVTLVTPRNVFLHARLVREGEVLLRSIGSDAGLRHKGVQTVLLDFPPGGETGSCDTMEIVLRGYSGWTLFGIDLIEVPRATRVPLLADGPELIRVGQVARVGLGLSSNFPLRGSCRVPQGALLTFSHAWPPEICDAGRSVELVLTIDPERGDERERRFPLVGGTEATALWTEVEVDLAPFAGRETNFDFRLEAEGAGEALCALSTPAVVVRREGAGTVFLVTSDTTRFDHLGSSKRGVDVRTPALDRLAETGVTFENCFSSANVTLPSHVALMTATSPRDTRVFLNTTPVTRAAATLAECFRDAGYRTLAVVSASHLSDPRSGLGQGFDRMWSPRGTCDSATSIDVLERWLASEPETPLFAWLHLFDAHAPYEPPQEFADRYYPADDDPEDPALPGPDFPVPSWRKGVRDVEHPRAMYRAEVGYLDSELARILDLERMRSGIVAFTADHGEDLGYHDAWWGHGGLYPDSIHVPLILRWPDAPPGTRESRPVHHVDLARTLLDLAGLTAVEFPGTSIVAPGTADADRPRFAIASARLQASVTVGSMHLILTLRQHSRRGMKQPRRRHAVELYDLARDPLCRNDLAEREHATAARLRTLLIDWLLDDRGTSGTAGEATMDEEALEALAELGYGTETDPTPDGGWIDPECDCPFCAVY